MTVTKQRTPPVGHRVSQRDISESHDAGRAGGGCEEQWKLHYGDLLRYTTSLLAGDVHAAEDVAQETAIRLWQHPEVLGADQPLGPWLRTVARNIVIDGVRRRKRRPPETELFSTEHDESDPADGITRVEALTWVNSALAELSTSHRTAVFEIYVRDRSINELASVLGVPTGTIKSRCHHALRQLRASTTA